MTMRTICLLILIPLWCFAAAPYVPRIADPVLEPWHWQEVEELGGLGVLCVDEAQDGTLWFGCIGGLVRYDGLTVEQVPFDEELLSGIVLNPNRKSWGKSVLCLRDGSLLALVDSGLARWADGEWEVILPNVGLSAFEARLEQAEDGTVWLLVSDTLWHFSEDLSGQHIVLRAKDDQRLTSFCRDEQGDAWVVRNIPLISSDLIHIPLQNGQPVEEPLWSSSRIGVKKPGRESGLCAGPDGKIWYVDNVAQNGVWAFDRRTGTWGKSKHPDSAKGYFSLMKDRAGTLWAGGPGLLFAIRRSGDGYYSSSQLGLPSIPVTIHETTAGKWWVIGRGGHVYSMDPSNRQWLTYIGLHFECETADGTQWFMDGTRHAVSHDPSTGKWLLYGTVDGLIDWPRSLVASSHGLVWAAGSHSGRAAIGVFDGNGWTRRKHPEFALFTGAGVLEARDGTLWFGAMGDQLSASAEAGGALQYEVSPRGKARLLKHHAPPELPYPISWFAQTRDEIIWLGSPVIYHYDVVSATAQADPELPSVYTQDLVVDGDDHLWVAKGLYGVFRKEADGWRNFSKEDGLVGQLVVDLLPLQDGTLLAASEKGISRFDGENWAGQVLNAGFGMSSRSGNMRQSADGAVWFNFTNKDLRSPQVSINVESKERFRTVRYVADLLAPDTSIENHLEQVESAGNIHMSWSGRDPWGNTPAELLQYSWRIDQRGWSPFSYETGRTFLRLDSGRHTLEVRARDRDFNVDSTPAKSWFVVALPTWRQAWFIGMILVMAATTAAFVRLLIYFHDKRSKDRAQHLIELDQMKTGFFTNISHELRTPLTLISRPLERLLESEANEEKREMLTMALRNANRVWSLASQLLDFRKLEQGKMQIDVMEGDIAQCIRDVIDNLRAAGLAKQIECRMEGADECFGWFDADKLKKIVQNLVNNAIKYTPADGEVRVVLNKLMDENGDEMLLLKVEDTGPGIESAHLTRIFDRFYRIPEKSIVDGSGIGLNLAKELVGLLGGTIRAESPIHPNRTNSGTRFTVCLPMGRDRFPGVLPTGGGSV